MHKSPTKRRSTYTSEEVAERLGVSLSSVYRMRKQGVIVPLSLGLRSVRYAKGPIDRMAEESILTSTERR